MTISDSFRVLAHGILLNIDAKKGHGMGFWMLPSFKVSTPDPGSQTRKKKEQVIGVEHSWQSFPTCSFLSLPPLLGIICIPSWRSWMLPSCLVRPWTSQRHRNGRYYRWDHSLTHTNTAASVVQNTSTGLVCLFPPPPPTISLINSE